MTLIDWSGFPPVQSSSHYLSIIIRFIIAAPLWSACKQPCDSLECSNDGFNGTIKVFVQASETADIRTIPALEITASSDYGADWTYQVESGDNVRFWVGTPENQSIHQVNWQFGKATIAEPLFQSTQNSFGQQLHVSQDHIIVGIPEADDSFQNAGAIQIWSKEPLRLVSTIEGHSDFQWLSKHIWTCGDLDGDGVSDWIVNDTGTDDAGRIWLGLSTIWSNHTGTTSIEQFPVIEGRLQHEAFGHHVLCQDDWNDDAQIDLVVSSPFANVNEQNGAGRISLWLNDGLGTFEESPSRINGQRSEGWMGYRLASGDVDGDGILEIAATTFEPENTAVQLYSFKANTWQERYRLRPQKFGTFWGYAVLIDDINGDQLDDVIISAPLADVSPYRSAGVIEIYPGTKNLLDWIEAPQEIWGTERNQRLGTHLSTADCNQDGLNDIIAQGYHILSP